MGDRGVCERGGEGEVERKFGIRIWNFGFLKSGKNLCDLCVSAVKQFQVIELFFTAEAQRTRRDGPGGAGPYRLMERQCEG